LQPKLAAGASPDTFVVRSPASAIIQLSQLLSMDLIITVILPTSKLPMVTEIDSVQQLEMLSKQYTWCVRAHTKYDPASIKRYFLPSEYKHLTPSHIVEIVSPFFTAKEEERRHHQIHDKPFEQKSRAAIIAYQNSMPEKQFRELDHCILGKDGKIAHEWEGVWECDDGTVVFGV
jgi:hypothetical protein